ncbi:MAG: 50S ribosomal protein L11 methyltransferase [Cyclobacteriaceae bacterium]
MDYTEIKFTLQEEFRDIIIAELSEAGFDTFLETEAGFNTYKDHPELDLSSIEEVIQKYSSTCSISYETTTFPDKNWNEEWEKNFEPIVVEDKCLVRAPFHKIEKEYPLEVLIDPKMAFGTGHHATTYLMLQEMMKIDIKGKDLIDLGSGTGILAIGAVKLGASKVWATDINEWSINNSKDNFALNGCSKINLLCGQIAELNIEQKFDVVLANINRNVLLEEIPQYIPLMRPDAIMILSGFFEEDEHLIIRKADESGLSMISKAHRNNWSVLVCKVYNQ